MDPEAFLDLANQVTKLKMFPYFDLAHAALCCLAVRDDLANGSQVRYIQAVLSLVELLHHCALIGRELHSDEIFSHGWSC